MSVFKSLCFVLVIGVFFSCNISIAKESESVSEAVIKANKYSYQEDYENAMYWYLKAASEGDSWAMFKIGFFYERGLGVKQDYQQAMSWYIKSADGGDMYGMTSIGELYGKGLGVKRDYQQALNWFFKAADKGQFTAMYSISEFYKYGLGVKEDQEKAKEWRQKGEEIYRQLGFAK